MRGPRAQLPGGVEGPSGQTAPPTARSASCLEVEDLSVRFGSKTVLSGVSFGVRQGSALAIIGPNGAGKTVLLRALIGAVRHEGQIRWAGGTKIGYVPQKLDLERDLPLTGLDFVRAKAAVSGADWEEVRGALGLARLSERLCQRPIGVLSGGQFQRLLVAAALVGRPNVLLLDEPTAGVDEPGQDALNETLDRLRADRGMTVLVISHDLSVVYHHASDVLCLGRGKVCFGPPRTLLTPALLEEVYGVPIRFHVHD